MSPSTTSSNSGAPTNRSQRALLGGTPERIGQPPEQRTAAGAPLPERRARRQVRRAAASDPIEVVGVPCRAATTCCSCLDFAAIARPSPALDAAWEAEGAALERGDIDRAVAAVVAAWTQPHAPEALRERVASMQRRALELQAAAGEVQDAPDPLEAHPEVLAELQIPVLLAAGEDDMADFRDAAQELAEVLPLARHAVITGAGHLAPLEAPGEFKRLLLDFLHNGTTR